MKETLKQLGFVKRYDNDFIEVKKLHKEIVNTGVDEDMKMYHSWHSATPYVYAPMLSEFAKSQTIIDSIQTRWDNVIEYRHFITQEITEEILDPFEAVIYRDGSWNIVDSSLNFILSQLNFHHYKTIEQAINDGVLFLFKED